MPADTYNVGCYLLDRLVELGCNHLFGVPGDYNLRFLDDVEASSTIQWVGCANELNAAYAADGYARVRRTVSAVLTTYGVGELSALNGIAGAYAERLPVLHIVGAPSRPDANAHRLLHHTLGDGDFLHFYNMSAQHLSCASTVLRDPATAPAEIDRVLSEMVERQLPGYITIPQDVAPLPVRPPAVPWVPRPPTVSQASVERFAQRATAVLAAAKSVSAVVGLLCDRYQAQEPAQALMDDAHIGFAHLLLGKATLHEESPNYLGCYHGAPTPAAVREAVEGADVCIRVGCIFHDIGTGGFSHKLPDDKCIIVDPFECRIGDDVFPQIPMAVALQTLRDVAVPLSANWPSQYTRPTSVPPAPATAGEWSQYHFWKEVSDGLQPGDILFADQGSCSIATMSLVMPRGAISVAQCLWGSIGYTFPAAFGAQVAAGKERRVVLAIGDGAAQMTVQQLGDFARHRVSPVVLLVNNDCYNIERVIHGWGAEYNEIASYDWCGLVKAFAGRRRPVHRATKEDSEAVKQQPEPVTHVADKPGVVAAALAATADADARQSLTFVEVVVGRDERPIVRLF